MTEVQVFGDHVPLKRRPLIPALKNGLRCRCPQCGEGKLFKSYSKSVDVCENCGEEIFHHRADDLPAYLNLFVVGHIMIGVYLIYDRFFQTSAWTDLAIFLPITLAMTFALLEPIKGFVIALQWANYMHGFGGEGEDGTLDVNTDPKTYG